VTKFFKGDKNFDFVQESMHLQVFTGQK